MSLNYMLSKIFDSLYYIDAVKHILPPVGCSTYGPRIETGTATKEPLIHRCSAKTNIRDMAFKAKKLF